MSPHLNSTSLSFTERLEGLILQSWAGLRLCMRKSQNRYKQIHHIKRKIKDKRRGGSDMKSSSVFQWERTEQKDPEPFKKNVRGILGCRLCSKHNDAKTLSLKSSNYRKRWFFVPCLWKNRKDWKNIYLYIWENLSFIFLIWFIVLLF